MHTRIDKINDDLWKLSLKPSMLGKDCQRNEYWFFKEDNNKVYVHEFKTDKWGMFDSMDEMAQLEASLSNKGVREKKLLEGIKRVKDMLKLKKRKETAAAPLL